jgi:transcriptional regulator with XRE-family HTH domain
MTLLEQLIELQKSNGLSNKAFAKLLGISDAQWIFTKQGKRKIRYETLSGALQAFPHNEPLKAAVLEYLSSSQTVAVA